MNLRQITFGALLLLGGIANGAEEPKTPPASGKIALNIASQAIGDALNEFGRQSGLHIVLYSALGKGIVSPRLNGNFTREAALKELLGNSGLRFEYLDARTIAILSQTDSLNPKRTTATEQDSMTMLRIGGLTDQLALASAGEQPAEQDGIKSAKSSKTGNEVEEMVVEGQRDKPAPFSTSNLDLTRSADDVLPFTTFTAQDIQLSGAISLEDFFLKRLSQNFKADIQAELDGAGTNDFTSYGVDMRGWGATETVFLLNGRRMPPQLKGSATLSNDGTPDLRSIPLGSIERIEVLTSAGSAIYGGSATGGVINIITRQDFKGGRLSLSYETPSDVHAPSRRVDLSYGTPLGFGMSVRLTAAYNDNEPLRAKDRSAVTVERWRKLVVERDPIRLLSRTNTPPYGATPNIRTATTTATDNLFGPGTANFTTVPVGYTGGGGLAAFQPGVYNLDLADSSAGRQLYAKESTLGPITRNPTFGLGVDKSFGQKWRWSVDYTYSQNDIEGQSNPNSSLQFNSSATCIPCRTPRVPAESPINPFGQEVAVSLIDPWLDLPEIKNGYANRTWSLSSTLRGEVGTWRGFFDLSYSTNSNDQIFQYFYEPIGGYRNAFLTGAYNPFVDMRVVRPAAPEFYQHYVLYRSIDSQSGNYMYQSALKLSGPLFRLPAGDVQLTTGLEWQNTNRHRGGLTDQYQDSITGEPIVRPGGTTSIAFNNTGDIDRLFEFDRTALYAEVNVPLLSSVQGVPMVKNLEIFASGRKGREALSSFRRSTQSATGWLPFDYVNNPTVYAYGFRYGMLEGVTFRASTSIGFKPPSISQISPSDPPDPLSMQTLNDPRRLNGTVPSSFVLTGRQWVSGGNPDLIAETTDSTNIGVILSPSWIGGMRLSIDYLESVRNDAITGISAQDIINMEDEFPGRVQRGAPDGHPSGVGQVIFVDNRNVNFRQIAARGIDLSLEQRFSNVAGGNLVLAAAVTKNISFKTQTTNTSPPVERIRNVTNTTFAQQIRWNGNGQMRWEGRQWSFGWSARYFDYVLVSLTDRVLQGSDRIPPKLNHDAFLSYRAPTVTNPRGAQWLLSGTSLTMGVKNVFDRAPRFWAAGTERGIAPYDSIMGRSIWLQANHEF